MIGPGRLGLSRGLRAVVSAAATAVLVGSLVSGAQGRPLYVEALGSYGTDPGDFSYPYGIAVDGEGNAYVADPSDDRIQKLSLQGGGLAPEWTFGEYGFVDGEFYFPCGIAVGPGDAVYVADTYNHRIQKVAQPAGSPSHAWSFGSPGTADGQFHSPWSVAVDSASNVYVADTYNHRVQKLIPAGGSVSHAWSFGSHGTADGQFDWAAGVAVDADGDLYVTDAKNNRVQKLSQSASGASHVWSYGTQGSGPGQFDDPRGVAVDAAGNVYVADHGNDRVQKFSTSPDGLVYEWSFGRFGAGYGEFLGVSDVAVDHLGDFYVTDNDNHRIQRWFDVELLPAGQTASFADLSVWSDAYRGNTLRVDRGKTLEVLGTMNVRADATLTLSSATLQTDSLIVTDSTVQVELSDPWLGSGGSTPGALVQADTVLLDDAPTLEVLPWNNLVPTPGDELVIMQWQTGLDGIFAGMVPDPWFAAHGITFDMRYDNVTGPGDLTLLVVPEPATLALLAVGGLSLVLRRKRRADQPPPC